MQLALEIDLSAASLQNQVFKQIHGLIVSGRLKPGARLPGTRALSEQLGVSRNTIILAYETLTSEGYLESREGAGTYVSTTFPDNSLSVASGSNHDATYHKPVHLFVPVADDKKRSVPPSEIVCDFALESTDPACFPRSVWRRLTNWRMQSSKFNLTYSGTPKGLRDLRETLAAYLGASRGISCNPDQIVIVTGVQQALNVAAHLFVRAGTTVAMEAPGCRTTADLFRAYGAHIAPVPVDQSGIVVRHLPQSRNGVAFATSARQYPMGVMLSASRRDILLSWADQTDSHIVEVDFDTEIRYQGSPPPPLKSLDTHGRVVYVGSFAASIGPGLRVGYMVLPPHLVDPAVHAASLLDHGFPCTGVPWLEQAVLNDFIETGAFEKHLRKIRKTYMARRDCLILALQKHIGSVQINPVHCGTHLVWELPPDFPSAVKLQTLMLKRQIGVYTLRDQNIGDADYLENCDRYLLLGFAALSETAIEEGISRLAKAL
ncbi:PLP-dependent aminotransferase family protein [Bradyrhizobium sp. RT3a]|uniref:MocR-like pyridoxine biosynthesis transcription factor PdxR n=1 Tax=unclassified Bradyrhizobium TaxID=2631580 RepID=UPI00339B965C